MFAHSFIFYTEFHFTQSYILSKLNLPTIVIIILTEFAGVMREAVEFDQIFNE